MYGQYWNNYSGNVGLFNHGLFGLFLVPLVLWSLVWKGWALWTAARKGDKWWYIALLLLNTAGILEIIYIFLISKQNQKTSSKKK